MSSQTPDELIAGLLGLDELEKVRLFHKQQTGRELTNEEIMMIFNDTQILDICEQFDTRVITDYPQLVRQFALQEDIGVLALQQHLQGDQAISDEVVALGLLREEIELLEAENEFVEANSADTTSDMPDTKKSKNK
jgi:hypothetical protein